jgi:hypothetical protein
LVRGHIEDVDNRAANVLLLCEYDQVVTDGDDLLLDSILKPRVVAREDFNRQIAFGVESNPRSESWKRDFKYLADV